MVGLRLVVVLCNYILTQDFEQVTASYTGHLISLSSNQSFGKQVSYCIWYVTQHNTGSNELASSMELIKA